MTPTTPADEFWVPAINGYKDKPFKSATRGGVDLVKITPPEEREETPPEPSAKLASLIAIFSADDISDNLFIARRVFARP